jgi:transposase
MSRKTYSDEFKSDAAKLVRDQGYSIKKAAQSLGVDQATIRAWLAKLAILPSTDSANSSTEHLHRENTRLREENRRLLMEREILPLNASIAL